MIATRPETLILAYSVLQCATVHYTATGLQTFEWICSATLQHYDATAYYSALHATGDGYSDL
jgi:hypothetical protein